MHQLTSIPHGCVMESITSIETHSFQFEEKYLNTLPKHYPWMVRFISIKLKKLPLKIDIVEAKSTKASSSSFIYAARNRQCTNTVTYPKPVKLPRNKFKSISCPYQCRTNFISFSYGFHNIGPVKENSLFPKPSTRYYWNNIWK